MKSPTKPMVKTGQWAFYANANYAKCKKKNAVIDDTSQAIICNFLQNRLTFFILP